MNGIRVRVHGSPALPTVIYLPGMHGDWTLVPSFRQALAGKVRFVEMEYPRTTAWAVPDYAREIEKALGAAGITEGWLIGESFGSQPAWVMLDNQQRGESALQFHGLILAGGFIKHPWPWGARLLHWVSGMIPNSAMHGLLWLYSKYAHLRHRDAPETLASVQEFAANRFAPGDKAALRHRYVLIAESDVRPCAMTIRLPVFHLAGLIDPLVPGPLVKFWLRRHCPGFQESRTILSADHNVLGSAPKKSAEVVLRWLGLEK